MPPGPAPLPFVQVGWAQSWSAFVPFAQQHGEAAARQLMQQYRHGLAAALRLPDKGTPVPTRWPLHLLLARQPRPLEEEAGR